MLDRPSTFAQTGTFQRRRYTLAACLLTGLLPGLLVAQAPSPDSPAIEQRVDAIVAKMSLEDKVRLLGGKDAFFTQPIPNAGLPSFRMADGPLGVRNWGPSTAYTAGIALAASWDTGLAHRVGASIGNDGRARGVNFQLGPGVNIYRSPRNGRNMEYFGEDPYLASRVAVGYIEGMQSKGVSATVKHFAGNNSEFDRHNSDTVIDERTLHEIYLPAFEAAVREAGVGAVMDSYNLLNGEHATQNHVLNVDILRKQWGFRGVLMSDWSATYDGVAAANNGLDLEMPDAKFMNAKTLLPAIQSGQVKQATIDEKVRDIVRTAVRFGWLDRPQLEPSIPLYSPQSNAVALDEALSSITLLKNDHSLLPLDASHLRTLVVLGPDAAIPVFGGGSSTVKPFTSDTLLTGLADKLGSQTMLFYFPGLPTAEELFRESTYTSIESKVFAGHATDGPALSMSQPDRLMGWRENGNYRPNTDAAAATSDGRTYVDRIVYTPQTTSDYIVAVACAPGDDVTVAADGRDLVSVPHHGGPGEPISVMMPLTAGKPVTFTLTYFTIAASPRLSFAVRDVQSLLTAAEQKMVQSADAVVVGVGLNASLESEGYDRRFSLPWGQDALVSMAAALNPKTIVDIQAGGAVDVHTWIDRVPALLDSYYGGQAAGAAFAATIFGHSPSGKLPMSWERVESDNPTFNHYEEVPGPGRKIPYSEGVFYGYRYYTSEHKRPLFPFGFGLTYSTFQISGLKLTRGDDAEKMLTVEFDVRNTGSAAAAEVPQVYVGDPSAKIKRPVKELKAFTKVSLEPGAQQHVTLNLDRRAFSYWDANAHDWRMDPGKFQIIVGNSSENEQLTQSVELK